MRGGGHYFQSGVLIVLGFLLGCLRLGGEAWFWPTPNPAFFEGKPLEEFIQPTVSGLVESGLFGCTRNGGTRFHEGIDLFPVQRDRRGEPIDPIYAALTGTVRHVNRIAGHSSYGIYILIEHEENGLVFYTLYSHLRDVAEGIQAGVAVSGGQTLGRMGRSAGGYTIPRERAHLHFEIGFRLSDRFDDWFDGQDFGSPNRHGNFNGMNLIGLDPLDFYRGLRDGKYTSLRAYVDSLSTPLRLRIFSPPGKLPPFLARNPALAASVHPRHVLAWDVDFTAFGLPVRWTPVAASTAPGPVEPAGTLQLISHDPEGMRAFQCRRLVTVPGPAGAPFAVGPVMQRFIELMFAFHP